MFVRTWNSAKLQQLQQLYQGGLSMRQVALKLGTSSDAVIKTMRRYQLPRRTAAQTKRILFRKSPQSFEHIESLTPIQRDLKTVGLMLYWAEGAKKGDRVDFANSSPKMIQVFCQFIREIYQVDEGRLRVLLYCHSREKIPEHVKYWSLLTKIPIRQFSKSYVRENKFPSHSIMAHGLVHIRYSDTRLLQTMLRGIDETFQKLITPGYSSGNEVRL